MDCSIALDLFTVPKSMHSSYSRDSIASHNIIIRLITSPSRRVTGSIYDRTNTRDCSGDQTIGHGGRECVRDDTNSHPCVGSVHIPIIIQNKSLTITLEPDLASSVRESYVARCSESSVVGCRRRRWTEATADTALGSVDASRRVHPPPLFVISQYTLRFVPPPEIV